MAQKLTPVHINSLQTDEPMQVSVLCNELQSVLSAVPASQRETFVILNPKDIRMQYMRLISDEQVTSDRLAFIIAGIQDRIARGGQVPVDDLSALLQASNNL